MSVRSVLILAIVAAFAAAPARAERLLVEGAVAEPSDTSQFGELTAVEIRLVDVTDATAPPRPVAGSKLMPGREPAWPLPFRIGVDSEDLSADRSYALEARIVADRVLFETAEPVPIDPFATETRAELTLLPPASAALLDVRWAAEEGGPDGLAPPQLSFSDGRISGRIGCRSLRGRTEIAGRWLRVTEASLDGMGCGRAAAVFEDAFLATLLEVERFAIEDGVLLLQSGEGATLVRLAPR